MTDLLSSLYASSPGPSTKGPRKTRRKLKDSCDGCSDAKIRCGKEKPACSRCAQKGFVCNYRLSQRMGQRRSRLPPDDQSGGQALPSPPVSTGTDGIDPAIWDQSFFTKSTMDCLDAEDYFSKTFTDSFLVDHTTDLPFLGMDMSESSDDISTSNSAGQRHSSPGFFNHNTMGAPSAPDPSVFEMLDATPSHDCMFQALELFRRLHVPQTCCSKVGNIQSYLSPNRPSLDNVLETNKKTINSMYSILECPCSSQPQIALLLSLITLKLIAWYGAATHVDSDTTTSPPAITAQQHDGTNRMPGLSLSPGSTPAMSRSASSECVSTLPFSVGRYQLDRDSEARIWAQLGLTELGRVEALVEAMSKRFRSGDHDRGTQKQSDGRSESLPLLSSGVEAVVRERLQAMTESLVEIRGSGLGPGGRRG